MTLFSVSSNNVLKPYIDKGKVDYDRIYNDQLLRKLFTEIENTDPIELSHSNQLAFWLNAYNITTLQAVLDRLDDNPDWPGVISVWDKFTFFFWTRHRIGRRMMSLFTLENKILRGRFDDPRIHFALNCASSSCPYLPGKTFEGDTIDNYLDELTRDFINNQGGIRLEGQTLYLSRIFKFYTADFGGEDNLVRYIQQYWEGNDLPVSAEIRYQSYDWSLNQQ